MAKKILIKQERKTTVDGRSIRLSKFEKHYVDDDKDFSTQYGMIKEKDLKKIAGSTIKSGKEEFIILNPVFIDHYKQIKRLAQIITLKDIGAIITYTGLTKDSFVLDAGAGSGAVSSFLGMLVKKVVSYDVNDAHLEVAKKNIETLNLKNVEVKKGDVYKGVDEKNIDVFVLDVPEPWRALKTAEQILKLVDLLFLTRQILLKHKNSLQG